MWYAFGEVEGEGAVQRVVTLKVLNRQGLGAAELKESLEVLPMAYAEKTQCLYWPCMFIGSDLRQLMKIMGK